MALLTREQILSASDLPREEVEVPEWGGTIIVQGMTAAERGAYEQSFTKQVKDKRGGARTETNSDAMREVRERLAVRCIVDDKGERLFGDGDVRALGEKSAVALERVARVAQRLNGVTEEDMEELAGNSDEMDDDDSSSDSRSISDAPSES